MQIKKNELIQHNFYLFISILYYSLQIIQIRCDDNSFNITFVKQTCVFNNKNMKEDHSDNAARNSNTDEKREECHIFRVKIRISITFDSLIEWIQMHDRQAEQYVMWLYSSYFEEHSEALSWLTWMS